MPGPESRLQEAALGVALSETSDQSGTGLQNPDEISSRVKTSTCVGRVLIGVKEPRRYSGLDEAVTAELMGRTAADLSDKPGDDFPI